MTLWQRITSFFRKAAPLRGISHRAAPSGRITVDDSRPFFPGGMVIVPPPDHESDWRLLNLDSKTLDKIEPARLMELLADLSPEVSKALWDFLRNFNPGWSAKAYPPGTDRADERAVVNAPAQEALDAFLNTLKGYYGAADVVWNKIAMQAFLRGAMFGELVLDPRGRMPVDIAVPDPESVRFRQVIDPLRGQIHVPGQWIDGEFVEFTTPTVRYLPIDPMPGVPYGRPLASPALFSSLFLLGLLHDLRRVVQQQGYPRYDIGIDSEKALMAYNMGPQLDSDGNQISFDAYVLGIKTQIETYYATLEPDHAFVHSDMVIFNKNVGTVDASSLGAIDGLIEALERMATRALKTMPFAFGLSESTTETQATRQYELYAAGIKSLQHYAENLLEHFLTLALEAQGIAASVRFRFSELRSAERLRDALSEAAEIANEVEKRAQGWITQDEASEKITGSAAVGDAPVQQTAAVGSGQLGVGTNADNPPSTERAILLRLQTEQATNGNGNGH